MGFLRLTENKVINTENIIDIVLESQYDTIISKNTLIIRIDCVDNISIIYKMNSYDDYDLIRNDFEELVCDVINNEG